LAPSRYSLQVFVNKNQEAVLDQLLEHLETDLTALKAWATKFYLILVTLQDAHSNVIRAYL
jgi:hypothetical protein